VDPKVRQSGEAPARSGRISKRGSASARWALVEAAWSVVKQPGPLRAFYERVRARRGHGKAIVATVRKLAILFWCMLRRGEDDAHQRPALTKKQLLELELTAGAEPRTKARPGSGRPTARSATLNGHSLSRPRSPTSGWSPTSKPEDHHEKWARARHRSAHK
jgi:transposase